MDETAVDPHVDQQPDKRIAHVGERVIWHDSYGNPYEALVTASWSWSCINLVFVSKDETKSDTYGRQIERATSCVHKSLQPVHGYYWRFPEEEPNPYKAPLEK